MASTIMRKVFDLFCVAFLAAAVLGCDVPASMDSADELSSNDVYEGDASYDEYGLDETAPMDTVDPCAEVAYLEQSRWFCGDEIDCVLTFVSQGDNCTVKCYSGGYGFIWESPINDILWTPSAENAQTLQPIWSTLPCTLASCTDKGCPDEE